MSATTYHFEDLPVRRWALEGASPPQGADGTAELAADAYADMAAAGWRRDDSPASMPVHDYDRPRPSGDAYKANFGYDADARTQRSCCGAVCYVVPVPAGASAASSVAATVRGDRYLDQGADVYVVAAQSETPLPLASVLALTPDATGLCATAGQEDASGNALPPNQRAGVTASVAVESPGAAAAYHVYILLHDYLVVRRSWIEGGAMLAGLEVVAEGWARDVFQPLYDIPRHGATTGGRRSIEHYDVVARYSSSGSILGVVEFPSRFWGGEYDPTDDAGAALTDAGAGWSSTQAAMRRLCEDVQNPVQSYGPYPEGATSPVRPMLCVNVWGGGLQITDPSANSGANAVTKQVSQGADTVSAIHVGYQLYDGASPQVVGVGAIVGFPFRQLGAGRRAVAWRSAHDILMGDHVTAEAVAYKAPRPPCFWAGAGLPIDGADEAYNAWPHQTCATPAAYGLLPRLLFSGRGSSINLRCFAGLGSSEGPGVAYRALALSYIGRWTLDADAPAGTEFPFEEAVADDDCTIVLCVRPVDFTRGGAVCPTHTQNCWVNWPFDGYQLVLG